MVVATAPARSWRRSIAVKISRILTARGGTGARGPRADRLCASDGRHRHHSGRRNLEYDPRQYRRLIQPILEGAADVVYGSRFLAAGPQPVLYFWHYVANRALTMLWNMFTDLNLSDMETCYKVFRREVLASVAPTLREDRFGIDAELTAKVARRKYRIYQVGISYFGRTYQEGREDRAGGRLPRLFQHSPLLVGRLDQIDLATDATEVDNRPPSWQPETPLAYPACQGLVFRGS